MGIEREALLAIADGIDSQIAFLHKYRARAPRIAWTSENESQRPESFETVGEHETDARYIYPARERLVDDVAALAIALSEQEQGE